MPCNETIENARCARCDGGVFLFDGEHCDPPPNIPGVASRQQLDRIEEKVDFLIKDLVGLLWKLFSEVVRSACEDGGDPEHNCSDSPCR